MSKVIVLQERKVDSLAKIQEIGNSNELNSEANSSSGNGNSVT